MQTLSIYMNPRASQGDAESWRPLLDRAFFRSERIYRVPESVEELGLKLKEDIHNKVDALIGVGGDGTINNLIQSLVKSNIGLLVIPAGTANDLACELGNKTTPRQLVHLVTHDEYKYIDLIKVNNRYMATNGGFGLGGQVAQKINELRRRYPMFKEIMKYSGPKIYSLFVARELLRLKHEQYYLRLESDEFSGDVKCSALLINNQPVVGGLKVAPQTHNGDGRFNVSLAVHKSCVKFMGCVLGIAAGIHPINDPDFISFETSKLKITPLSKTGPLPHFFGDGEIFEQAQNGWDISIEPHALKVYSGHRALLK